MLASRDIDSSTEIAFGKRKRSSSASAEMNNDENERRKKEAIQSISKALLAVLKMHDPTPSILDYSISSIEENEPGNGSPPSKRTKLSSPTPDTINERLATSFYTSFSSFLADVSAVCKALLYSLESSRVSPNTGQGSTRWENTNTAIGWVIHFEQLAKDLVMRDLKRRIDDLDLTKEAVEIMDLKPVKPAETVVLTVMTYSGPVFSSLPRPDNISIASAESSRSSSATGTRDSPASTVATSIGSSPKFKEESISVAALFDEPSLPPLVSTVRAADVSLPSQTDRVLKLGEAFPPIYSVNLQPLQTDNSTIGLKWGGKIGPGGTVMNPAVELKTENSGHWLQYTNYPKPGMSRLLPDPFRQGIGLPANFVAAYSSFAPTRDDSFAKIPSANSDAIWWQRRGGKDFRKYFGDDPAIGHMFQEYKPKTQTETVPSTGLDGLDEEELKRMLEEFDDTPIDTQLLDGNKDTASNEAVLAEISMLLEALQCQQYTRLATPISTSNEAILNPTKLEFDTYQKLCNKLSSLVSSLAPHVLATDDGHSDSELNVSKKIPALNGMPVYKGLFPSEDSSPGIKHPPQIQAAAMTAMNAAAGLSPVSPAPVANMLAGGVSPAMQMLNPLPLRVQSAGNVTLTSPSPVGTPGVYQQPQIAHSHPPHTPVPQQNYHHPHHQYQTSGSPHPNHHHPQQQQQQQQQHEFSPAPMATPPSYATPQQIPQRHYNYSNSLHPPSHPNTPHQHQQRVQTNAPPLPPQGPAAVNVHYGQQAGMVGSLSPGRYSSVQTGRR